MRRRCEQRCEEKQRERESERERERGREVFFANPREVPAERRLEQCRRQCEEAGGRRGEQQRHQCEQRCWERYREERQQEQQDAGVSDQDPQEKLQQCRRWCEERHQGDRRERRRCEEQCDEKYSEERGRGRGNPRREEEKEEEEEEEERGGENPYVFEPQSFKHRLRSEHGHFKVLKKFHKQSNLLIGIANYRLAILELNPQTFAMPNHWDADDICYVIKGRGTVTILRKEENKEERESHEINKGDIMQVPAGSIVYVINSDRREKLTVAKLLQPVSTPGRFEHFFGAGGKNPESFFSTFSNEVLEAAFNTPRDKLERIFGRQRKGAIIRATEEQIRAMSRHHSGEGGRWPFGESVTKGPFNLLKKRPAYSNRHGQLYEADSNDYRPLKKLNVEVSFANLSSGSMIAPFYNTHATKIALVTEGRGYVELVCPHLAGQRWEGQGQREGQRDEEEGGKEGGRGQHGQRYQRVHAQVSPGTVFVIPPGHPAVEVASRDQNLQVICFEIRAENNQKVFLAGRNNILNKMEREAKELSFDASAREVDEVFNAQKEEVLLAGPEEWQRGGRGGKSEYGGRDMASIVEVVAGF
ncbi:cupincin-like [Ananas comosus]|nr:cupincin-like [Ananas comosus]